MLRWGFGTAAVPGSLEIHLIGHVPTVARLDVVERPCDDDPPRFSKLGVQLGLELVADLGSQLGPAKPTIRRPISVSAGIKRTVNGSKEIANAMPRGVGS